MKKLAACILVCCVVISLAGCGRKEAALAETIEGNIKTYYKLSDGKWKCDDIVYTYRLEISGRISDTAAEESAFVYLSNLEEITFEQAWKAAGLSSDAKDYFSPDEAVLVEWK